MSELTAQNALAALLGGWTERVEEAQLHVDKALTRSDLDALQQDTQIVAQLVYSMIQRLPAETEVQP